MLKRVTNIYRLGIKELLSLRYDSVLVFMIIYSFTFAIYTPAKWSPLELEDASVAVVDEDRSPLSERISAAFVPPYFKPSKRLDVQEIDTAMDTGRYTFVLDIPPDFQADVFAGRQPAIQVNVDATAITHAGRGAGYVRTILTQEVSEFLQRYRSDFALPVNLVIRTKFNPNLQSSWFLAVTQIINNITMLAIILTGAALIREREHGTIEHLLVMPLRPAEIMIAKVWANGLVIVIASTLSLWVVVQWLLEVPVTGSISLFVFGTILYLFSVTALGIFLATVARSMPQFGLLALPVIIVMILLSGGTTPLDSMPETLQYMMQLSPSTHFVSFAQAILYRGAGFDVVWPEFAAVAAIGVVFFAAALLRFRASMAAAQA